jgi:hypothetical protein
MGYAAQQHFDPSPLVAFEQYKANFEHFFDQTED